MRLLKTLVWCTPLLASLALGGANRNVPFATKVTSMEYPPLAAMARISGAVVLRVEINSTGAVVIANGLSGHPILVKAAEQNVKLWKFSPGRSAGEKAASEFDLTYVFKLQGVAETSHVCTSLAYEYPDKITITSEAPHWQP